MYVEMRIWDYNMYVKLGALINGIAPLPESLSFLSVPEYGDLKILFFNIESGAWSFCWETELLPNLNPIDRIKMEKYENIQVWDDWIKCLKNTLYYKIG